VRTIAWIRNYCLLVFFIVLAGGVILKPGWHPAARPTPPAYAASHEDVASTEQAPA
jgi:hypothetical protein